MTTPNEMPDVIWAGILSNDKPDWTPFQFQVGYTSYTRTDLLEQRAKVAAAEIMSKRAWDLEEDELTAIIIAAVKGETK